ncbi:stability determinant [Janthinobacterium sp. GMG1]|uniref:type II toxin-antitoxin system RelB family antitoxin n=1 Tax=Janthinobacterium sp. GMG1 TaxID=3096007 RepID=UPI002ACAE0EA|nr:stability determinant [Janthinobacterium sp. GMG1]MDZ5636873.1 stability determinant [Janthinobacterium sp. GMG1]
MNASPSSTTSEFATTEAAETYDHWFRTKVLASLNDDRPTASHETVMAQLRKIVTPQTDGRHAYTATISLSNNTLCHTEHRF